VALAVALFILSSLFLSSLAYADSVGPTISIYSPSDGKTVWTDGNGGSYPVRIVFRAIDVGGDTPLNAGSFELGVDGAWEAAGLVQWGAKVDFYYYDWDIPVTGEKPYLLQVRGRDSLGNPGYSREMTLNVRVAPVDVFGGFPGDGALLVRDNDNTLCISCHELKSHSSADVESAKYGNWERVCRDCHTPHNTRNIFVLASSFKIYTGANQDYAYNKKVDFRNLSGQSSFGFVTKGGSERRGPCEVCHTRTQNSDASPRWRNYTSEPDVDGFQHNAGISCIDCHTHEGGFKGSCTSCHGFPPATAGTLLGGADTTGGSNPTGSLTAGAHGKHATVYGETSATCNKCHNGGMGSNNAVDGTINFDFNAFGLYTTGDYKGRSGIINYTYSGPDVGTLDDSMTCQNVKCHGGGGWLTSSGGTMEDPIWSDAATGQCGDCHGVKKVAGNGDWPTTNGHAKHAGTGSGEYDFMCKLCHSATVLGTSTSLNNSNHVNGLATLSLYTADGRIAANSSYGGDSTVNSGFGSCDNLYCHSEGNRFSNFSAPNQVLNWNQTRACNSCHGNSAYSGWTSAMPNYPNNSPKANSHAPHVLSGIQCKTCHASTTADNVSIKNTVVHVNAFYNLSVGDGMAEGFYAYSTSTKTCYNVTCHGGAGSSVVWGSTGISCQSCHLSANDTDDFVYNNAIQAKIAQSQWTSIGHGKTTGTYAYTGNSAAAKICTDCHTNTVGHGDAANPFRLMTSDPDGFCLKCHGTGSQLQGSGFSSITGVQDHSYANLSTNGYKNLTSWRFIPKCIDCHDPHGDSNIAMIHSKVATNGSDTKGIPNAFTNTSTVIFTKYTGVYSFGMADGTSTYICESCHTRTAYHKQDGVGSHNDGAKCTSCHEHTTGFTPAGDCSGCHGYPPDVGDSKPYQDAPTSEGKGAHVKHINHIAALEGVTLDPVTDEFGLGAPGIVCGTCHTNDSANHMSGDRVISFGTFSTQHQFGSNKPVYNGVVGVSSGTTMKTCSNVRCHFKESKGWQDPATAGD